jgi:hypothetical protein
MNSQRLDKLLGWLSIGGIAAAAGGFLLVFGWLFPSLGGKPAYYRQTPVDPHIALGGGLLLLIIGVFFVARAIIGKLRSND